MLVARLDDDEVQVDVGRPGYREGDHFGDVVGGQWGEPGVDVVGLLGVAAEAHQRELSLHHAGRDLDEPHRLPEVFAGFERESYGVPVRYPVACHPQAWAAGTVSYLIQAVLALTPDGFERRLRIHHLVLPEFVQWLELRRLRIGNAHADPRFQRAANGTVHAVVVNLDGDLDVVIEDDTENVRKKWDL